MVAADSQIGQGTMNNPGRSRWGATFMSLRCIKGRGPAVSIQPVKRRERRAPIVPTKNSFQRRTLPVGHRGEGAVASGILA